VPNLLTFVLVLLAVARLTRLVTVDKIGHPLRYWITMKNGDHGAWTFAIHCPWCVGMWFSLGAAPLWYYFGRNPIFIMMCTALALSHAVGLLAKTDQGD
jgi:hypothetical protein